MLKLWWYTVLGTADEKNSLEFFGVGQGLKSAHFFSLGLFMFEKGVR